MNEEYLWLMITLGWLYHRSLKINEFRQVAGAALSVDLIKAYARHNAWNAIVSALATLIVFLVLYLDMEELAQSESRSAWKLALILAATIGYAGDSMVKNVFAAGEQMVDKRLRGDGS